MRFSSIDFDKFLFSLYVFFLPFTNIFVVNVGFPLKISEIILFLLLFIQIAMPWRKIWVKQSKVIMTLLLLFALVAIVSTTINAVWQYDYKLNYFEDVRFSYKFDSFLKLFYIILAITSFFLLKNQLNKNVDHYIRVFLKGGIVACVFSWYLFFAFFFHYSPVFFNNSVDPPQMFAIPFFGEFFRSGTFKEGNHMGLFLLVCVFLSHQLRSRSVFLFSITIITTFSTPAFIGCLAYFLFYYALEFIRRRAYFRFVLLTFFSLTFLFTVFSNEYVRTFTINKLSESEEHSDLVSKNDRMELVQTGFLMGSQNFILGVGPSNYSLHYNKFTRSYDGINSVKRIANNIYLEIFSEIGVFALGLFILFLFLIFWKADGLKGKVGFCVFLVYLNVYPSFTFLFLWFYFAVLLSKDNGVKMAIYSQGRIES